MKPNKTFAELLSPLSVFVLWLGFTPMLLVVLQPSLWEYVVFILVDIASLLATMVIDRPMFWSLWPETKAYFPVFDDKSYAERSTEDRKELFQSMVRFPQRRAIFCSVVSYIKVIPALLVVVFYWEHSIPHSLQLARAIAVFSLMFCYFYGALYFEFHQRVSNVLKAIHQEQDWTDVFRQAAPDYSHRNFDISQFIAVAAIWVFMAAAQALVILDPVSSSRWVAAEIVVISLGGMVLFYRLWLLERNYFVGGLRDLFRTLEKFDPAVTQQNLSLHSSPILAHFEKSFNALMDRLRSNERELSHWIFSVSEQSRFRALGETSGLIVHDLGTPLQVVSFCADQLIEDPKRIQNPRYIEQLQQNIVRALELIQSWRAYLKNQRSGENRANIEESLSHVRRLLATQFEPYLYNSIQIVADPRLTDIGVVIPRAELIHILVNLITNSFNNLIQNQIPDAVITVKLISLDSEMVTFSVEDNGTGLAPPLFEKLTAFQFLPQDGEKGRAGMGLRLVRRLIEQNGGQLQAVEKQRGTELRLTLKTVNSNVQMG